MHQEILVNLSKYLRWSLVLYCFISVEHMHKIFMRQKSIAVYSA
jgi:hypothetical protein